VAVHLRARVLLNLAGLVLASILFGAKGALACSVCFVAEEETRVAFLVTTGLLTLLPLAFAGGVVYWLVKRARHIAELERSPDLQ
jgi:hypothetical protein